MRPRHAATRHAAPIGHRPARGVVVARSEKGGSEPPPKGSKEVDEVLDEVVQYYQKLYVEVSSPDPPLPPSAFSGHWLTALRHWTSGIP